MANEQYIIIPGTQQRVYDGTVVILNRLPNLKWIIHYGYYTYGGRKQKGWYFSSIPSDSIMPVFNEDLVAMRIIDGGQPEPGPCPPGPPIPPPGPFPPGPGPVPVPIPFTPADKKQVDEAMLTVNSIADRDKLSSRFLQNGKVVRVNDSDGHGKIEYYSWNSTTRTWEEASLGYRYMTREEIELAIADDIVSIVWSNDEGSLVLSRHREGAPERIVLTGVAHDPSYSEEDLELRIPRYGQEDLIIKIPRDKYMKAIRFEKDYEFPDGHVGPAIVVTVSDGTTEEEIAGDATGLVDAYTGGETRTATVIITADGNIVTADVKISTKPSNRIKIDDEGLYVDTADLEEAIEDLKNKTDVGEGPEGEIVVTTDDGIIRSSATLGGDIIDPEDTGEKVAKEKAVVDIMSWHNY